MCAFAGLKLPYRLPYSYYKPSGIIVDEIETAIGWTNEYSYNSSAMEFIYSFGKKTRIPNFIGPIKSGVRLLTAHEVKTQETTQLI